MQAIFGIVLIIFALSGVIVWIDRHPVALEAPITPSDLAASPAAAPAVFSETGMVVIEEREGSGGVAWLVYEAPNRPIATKKLIFEGLRTCAVEAGDLPCAVDDRQGRLPVRDGQKVHIEGYVRGEQVDVGRITYL